MLERTFPTNDDLNDDQDNGDDFVDANSTVVDDVTNRSSLKSNYRDRSVVKSLPPAVGREVTLQSDQR